VSAVPGADTRLLARAAVATVTAAAATWSSRRAADSLPAPALRRWDRVNHRGATLSLLEGPAVAAGLVAGAVLGAPDRRTAAACVVAAAGAAAFGVVDDLTEDTTSARKGLRGHLGALAHGELTTGGLKVLGIGATSLLAAALLPDRDSARRFGRVVDVGVSGALVAATANLVNLLDLRPGRALKAAGLAAVPLLAGRAAPVGGAVLGSAVAALPRDLGERDMLGDGGANALGALVGLGAVGAHGRVRRLALLAGAVGLTLASERVSFTEVIARTPVLREIDAWGRR
jgi:UDP-N-acetylmuramyl pentapeptide phosphotransferase/UDP-N-acetylglucosamine-1-phosphate transferase